MHKVHEKKFSLGLSQVSFNVTSNGSRCCVHVLPTGCIKHALLWSTWDDFLKDYEKKICLKPVKTNMLQTITRTGYHFPGYDEIKLTTLKNN